MRRWLVILILTGAGMAVWLKVHPSGTSPVRGPTVAPTVTVPPRTDWKPEEIAKDPQGYLVWSDQQIQQQVAERQKRRDILSQRRQEIESRQSSLVEDAQNVQNVHNRMQRAYDQAVDEDRWPIRMAGRTFERARAQQILDQTAQWLSERKPLTDAYADAISRINRSDDNLRSDIDHLRQMRDKVALDLERVRLNQGLAELESLNKSAVQLASMAQALSKMSDEQSPKLPDAPARTRIDIDSLLK